MGTRRLDPSRPYKPLDVGEAGVTASIDDRGRLVYVAQTHPDHGVVTLVAGGPLPPERRYDQDAVRQHRQAFSAQNAPAFGLGRAGTSPRTHPAWLLEDAVPATGLPGATQPLLATFVPHPDDADGVAGVIQVVLSRTAPPPLAWRGTVRIARAEYPELTEAAPLPELGSRLAASATGPEAALHDRELAWSVALSGDFASAVRLTRRGDRVSLAARLRPEGRVAALGLGADPEAALAAARGLARLDPEEALERELERWRTRWAGWPHGLGRLDDLARRGLAYVLGACAVPVGETVCLVTDHRILPLAWTRDGYFMARALLLWHAAEGPPEAAEVVRRHLDWLFERADRPESWWARSHLVGGQRKDPLFQLDQQLYPLLELCDYVEMTGDRAPLERHGPSVAPVLRAIERRRAPRASLYATEETPADDPLELPYETSNQILAWRTFSRLHGLGFGGGHLDRLAQATANAVRDHQVVRGPDGQLLFAYATDLDGRALLYHDANDLPLALAPAWGFCSGSDPVWRATIHFAFSPANPGFFSGRYGGLGSLHTPAAWPLGQVQAILIGRATADEKLTEASEEVLARQALWDDALPEANDPGSAVPCSRPWFGWPGAAVAAQLLEAWLERAPTLSAGRRGTCGSSRGSAR